MRLRLRLESLGLSRIVPWLRLWLKRLRLWLERLRLWLERLWLRLEWLWQQPRPKKIDILNKILNEQP